MTFNLDSHVPRDIIMSVAMLVPVTMTILHQEALPVAVDQLCNEYIRKTLEQSCDKPTKGWSIDTPLDEPPMDTPSSEPLPLFSQLALCHAMIAKLSNEVVVSIEVGDKRLLLWMFPVLCDLFDRYSESMCFNRNNLKEVLRPI